MRRPLLVLVCVIVCFVHSASADSLGASDIQPVVAANRPAMKACYDRAREKAPDLQVRMRMRLTIEPSGHVSRVTDEAPDAGTDAATAGMRACVIDVLRNAKFPKGDSQIQVNLPVVFIASSDAGVRDARAD